MPKIQILGSCSGTEPMPSRHHTSVVLTQNDCHYFLDAGENCSRLAHLGGVDLLKIRAIFLSHTHYDHIGGLTGLLWNIRKLCNVKKQATAWKELSIFIPEIEAWDGIKTVLSYTEGGFWGNLKFTILPQKPQMGLFYEDENLKIYAFPSHHLPDRADGTCRSFSYRIELADFTMVYSGDVGAAEDLALPVGEGCDLLMAETGHHKVKDICDFAENHSVGELVFYHHGREILFSGESVEQTLDSCKINTIISEDGMVLVR